MQGNSNININNNNNKTSYYTNKPMAVVITKDEIKNNTEGSLKLVDEKNKKLAEIKSEINFFKSKVEEIRKLTIDKAGVPETTLVNHIKARYGKYVVWDEITWQAALYEVEGDFLELSVKVGDLISQENYISDECFKKWKLIFKNLTECDEYINRKFKFIDEVITDLLKENKGGSKENSEIYVKEKLNTCTSYFSHIIKEIEKTLKVIEKLENEIKKSEDTLNLNVGKNEIKEQENDFDEESNEHVSSLFLAINSLSLFKVKNKEGNEKITEEERKKEIIIERLKSDLELINSYKDEMSALITFIKGTLICKSLKKPVEGWYSEQQQNILINCFMDAVENVEKLYKKLESISLDSILKDKNVSIEFLKQFFEEFKDYIEKMKETYKVLQKIAKNIVEKKEILIEKESGKSCFSLYKKENSCIFSDYKKQNVDFDLYNSFVKNYKLKKIKTKQRLKFYALARLDEHSGTFVEISKQTKEVFKSIDDFLGSAKKIEFNNNEIKKDENNLKLKNNIVENKNVNIKFNNNSEINDNDSKNNFNNSQRVNSKSEHIKVTNNNNILKSNPFSKNNVVENFNFKSNNVNNSFLNKNANIKFNATNNKILKSNFNINSRKYVDLKSKSEKIKPKINNNISINSKNNNGAYRRINNNSEIKKSVYNSNLKNKDIESKSEKIKPKIKKNNNFLKFNLNSNKQPNMVKTNNLKKQNNNNSEFKKSIYNSNLRNKVVESKSEKIKPKINNNILINSKNNNGAYRRINNNSEIKRFDYSSNLGFKFVESKSEHIKVTNNNNILKNNFSNSQRVNSKSKHITKSQRIGVKNKKNF